MSLRREAARTVFCFFFGGDEMAKPSLALDGATAFSAAATGRSPAGAVAFEACGGSRGSLASDAVAGASLRPNGSRAIGELSTVFRIRTIRGLGAIADAAAAACADVWPDASLDVLLDVLLDSWTCTSPEASGAILPARISGPVAGESALALVPACVSWEPAALAASTDSDEAVSEWRSATTPDTHIAPANVPSSRAVAAIRISRRKRGEGDKSPNSGCRSECSMRSPAKKRDKNFQIAEQFQQARENDVLFHAPERQMEKSVLIRRASALNAGAGAFFRSPKFSARAPLGIGPMVARLASPYTRNVFIRTFRIGLDMSKSCFGR
jgi:hypothetical protein